MMPLWRSIILVVVVCLAIIAFDSNARCAASHQGIFTSDELYEHITSSVSTCAVDKTYWHLIYWFLRVTTHVEITDIEPPLDRSAEFATHDPYYASRLTRKLMKKTTLLVKTYKVGGANFYAPPMHHYRRYGIAVSADGQNYSHPEAAQRYDYNPPVRQIFNATGVDSRPIMFRTLKPRLGSIVIVTALETLQDFLRGTPRHPFFRPAGNFVIIVSDSGAVAKRDLTAHVMQVLWRDYRTKRVFIVLACDQSEHLVGHYNPFHPPDEIDAEMSQDSWGALYWTPVDMINTEGGWLLQTNTNFYRYPLVTSVFRRYPTLIPIEEVMSKSFLQSYIARSMVRYAAGYAGFDAMIAGNLADSLNLSMVPYVSDQYGGHLANGSFSGSLADVLEQRVDISMNGRFLDDYGTDDVDFVLPVFADQFCIVCPAARRIPGWSAMFRCFAPGIWCGLTLANALCAVVWCGLKATRAQLMAGRRPVHRWSPVLVVMKVFWMAAAIPVRMPTRTAERTLIGAYLFVNLIVVGTFQGSLMRFFSKPFYFPEIDTLQQLDESGYPIDTSSPHLNLFGSTDGPLVESLRSKFRVHQNDTYSSIYRTAEIGDVCSVERRSDMRILMRAKFMPDNIRSTVHVVKECPRNYHLAFILKKDSPFSGTLVHNLRVFYESGLLKRWYSHMERALINQNRWPPHHIPHASSFRMKDLQIAFYVWLAGCTLAALAFGAETVLSNGRLVAWLGGNKDNNSIAAAAANNVA